MKDDKNVDVICGRPKMIEFGFGQRARGDRENIVKGHETVDGRRDRFL